MSLTHSANQETEQERHHATLFRDGRDPTLPANHPINAFSAWKKFRILATLSFSGFLANYSVAAIQVAFVPMSKTFGVAVPLIPNSIGYNLLGIAVGPIIWNPLSRTIGRRPTYLIGSVLFIPCVIWMALSPTYTSFCIARAIAGLFSSWSQTVPPATVADIFIKEVRGSKMSLFGTMIVIAPTVAPIVCGLVVNSHSWRVLFWIVLGLAGLQLLLIWAFVPETLWIADPIGENNNVNGIALNDGETSSGHVHGSSSPAKTQLGVSNGDIKAEQEMVEESTGVPRYTTSGAEAIASGHCGPAFMPWRRPGEFFKVFMSPILMAQYAVITLTSFYYGSIFAWSVGITIVMPQRFEAAPYDFSEIALGCAFAAFGIGGLLGKWSGGIVGDMVVRRFEKKHGIRQPEYRLWAMLPLLPFMFVGCFIVGITLRDSLHWIAYLMGGALYFYCLSAATGILQTYVMETYISRSMDTQAVFVTIKAFWGFAIAFFVTEWGTSSSYFVEYCVQGALAAGVGLLLCAGFIVFGERLRKLQGMPMAERKVL